MSLGLEDILGASHAGQVACALVDLVGRRNRRLSGSFQLGDAAWVVCLDVGEGRSVTAKVADNGAGEDPDTGKQPIDGPIEALVTVGSRPVRNERCARRKGPQPGNRNLLPPRRRRGPQRFASAGSCGCLEPPMEQRTP